MRKILIGIAALLAIAAVNARMQRDRACRLPLAASERQDLRDALNDDFNALKEQVKGKAKDLNQKMADEKGTRNNAPHWNGRFDRNVQPDVQEQVRKDMDFVQSIQGKGASGMHQQIFSSAKVNGPAYISYFDSSLGNTRIGYERVSDHDVPAEGAPGWLIFAPKMWLTQNYSTKQLPRMLRIMILFHEARHLDTAHEGWAHVACPDNGLRARDGTSLAGVVACDNAALGAYGSSLIMLKNIEKYCTNCPAKDIRDAHIYADNTLKQLYGPGREDILNDLYR